MTDGESSQRTVRLRKYAFAAFAAWCAFLVDWGLGVVQLEPLAWNPNEIVIGGWLLGLWTPGILFAATLILPYIVRHLRPAGYGETTNRGASEKS